jgi:hypothetical protein
VGACGGQTPKPAPPRGSFLTDGGGALRARSAAAGPALGPAAVAAGRVKLVFRASVDGNITGTPLIDAGGAYVVTDKAEVYRLDSRSGAVVWKRQLSTPAEPASLGTPACADIGARLGILSTPVIDTGGGRLLVSAFDWGPGGAGRWRLHSLTTADGAESSGWPVTIDATATNLPGVAFAAAGQLQRTALLLQGGHVFLGFGSVCDRGDYRGWVADVGLTTRRVTLWADEPAGHRGGGIWQSGGGLVGYAGNILLATGNGDVGAVPDPVSGLGQAVLGLAPATSGLSLLSAVSPPGASDLNPVDGDVGSANPLLVPATGDGAPAIVQGSKSGALYSLRLDPATMHLSLVATNPGGDPALAGPALWTGSDGARIYIVGSPLTAAAHPPGHPPMLREYTLDAALGLKEVANGGDIMTYGTGPALVTRSGASLGAAVVWVSLRQRATGTPDATLIAYAADGLRPLAAWPTGAASKFVGPSTDGELVYVAAADQLLAFG